MIITKTERILLAFKLMDITRAEFAEILGIPIRRLHSYLGGHRQMSETALKNIERLAKKIDDAKQKDMEKRFKAVKTRNVVKKGDLNE